MTDRYREVRLKIEEAFQDGNEMPELLDAIARILLEHVADSASIDLVEDDGSVGNAVLMHRNLTAQQKLAELRTSHPLPPTAPYGYFRVIKTGKSQFIRGITSKIRSRFLPGSDGLSDDNLVRAYICVPLIAHGRTLGALTIIQSDHSQPFSSETLLLLEEIADGIAIPLDGHLDGRMDGHFKPSVDGHVKIPVDGHVKMPVDGHVKMPVDGHVKMPVDGHVKMPVDGHVKMPVDGHVKMPVDGHVKLPVDGHAKIPVDGHAKIPVDGHAKIPVDGHVKMPVDGHVKMPVDGHAKIPVDGQFKAHVDGHSEHRVDGEVSLPSDGEADEHSENVLDGELPHK